MSVDFDQSYSGTALVISVTTCKNNQSVPLTFPKWLGKTKMDTFIEDYKAWLKTCYTEEENRSVVIDSAKLSTALGGKPAPETMLEREALKCDLFVDKSLVAKMRSFDNWEADGDDEDESQIGGKRPRTQAKETDEGNSQSALPATKKARWCKKRDAGSLESSEPQLSKYECKREENMSNNWLALAGLSHMQKMGYPLEGLTGKGYREHARAAIRDGLIPDPALPAPAPNKRTTPKPIGKSKPTALVFDQEPRRLTRLKPVPSTPTADGEDGTVRLHPPRTVKTARRTAQAWRSTLICPLHRQLTTPPRKCLLCQLTDQYLLRL